MTMTRRLTAGALGATVALAALVTAGPAYAASSRTTMATPMGGLTTVTLDPTALSALVSLGVAPIGPTRIFAQGGATVATFPIAGQPFGTFVAHSGGLSFSGPGVRISNFLVNTSSGFLTAQTSVKGTQLGAQRIFTLGAAQPISGSTPWCSGIAAGLTLTKVAAGALGVPSAAGLFVGDACVVPAMAPSWGNTAVTLDPTALGALVSLGVAPIGPARIGTSAGSTVATFPIAGPVFGTFVAHGGGLSFSGPGVRISNFLINTSTGFLTAQTSVHGTSLGAQRIFTLGAAQPISGSTPWCSGIAAGLTLTKVAAGALGVPSAAGLFIGDACVTPAGA